MDPKTVAEVFRQTIEGLDIPAPAGMLRTIKASDAARRLPGFPYSILENLWHAVFWQEIWLNRVEGKKAASFMQDWQSPDPTEFADLRARFVANEERARKLCSARAFKHKMASEEKALQTLVAMAVHDAYHLGQINLMKRAMRKKGSRV
jgi:uncharacterized damage-inducible protein DinB